jgi:hypothetical protein
VFPSFFNSDADVLRPIFPAALTNAVRTPAGISFERLSRASGLQITDRLLVMGILSAEALGALIAMGTSAVTLIRPERPYPSPAQADVVWLLDIDRMDVMTPRLRTGLRCLASGGRLLIELSAAESAAEAGSLAARLRFQGLQSVRIEELRPGVALVRGCARPQRRRAA